MWLDISTYITQRSPTVFSFSILAGFFAFALYASQGKDIKKTWALTYLGFYLVITVCLFIPTHDRLFDLKVSKIKQELTTKDNANKLIEKIDELAKELATK